MIDTENIPVEELWYTWSDVGLSTIHAGFRIRAASSGLSEIYSERVKSMDRHMRYVLPPTANRFAVTPEEAPVCLAFIRTDWGEYILMHKKYVGKDGVGRLGNFFVHLLAFGEASSKFSIQDAIWLWNAERSVGKGVEKLWKTSDETLDRRDNHLDPIALSELEDYQSFRPNYIQVQKYLPFIIGAYLTRRDQQPIYIAAPADSVEMITSLIAGLTLCLPQQLLKDLTFSTYEPEVTKAAAQIVGTSWIAPAGQEDAAAQLFAAQLFTPQFYRENLAVNCYTGEHSLLKNHPLMVHDPELAELASNFAQYATHCLILDDKALPTLLEEAEKDPKLTVEGFLRLYYDKTVNQEDYPQKAIIYYLSNPIYRIEKLCENRFRQSIINAILKDSHWWESQLQPLLLDLQKQSRREDVTALQYAQSQKTAVSKGLEQDQSSNYSAKVPRKKSKKSHTAQQGKPSTTLTAALSWLAESAMPIIVAAMRTNTPLETTSTRRGAAHELVAQEAKHELVTQEDKEVVIQLLNTMYCCLWPEDPTGGWKKLLDSILARPDACHFLTSNWDILAWLLTRWDIAFAGHPEYDEAVYRVLIVSWSHLGEFLKLPLRVRHSAWNVFVVEEIIGDASLTPDIAQYLRKNYEGEINDLLEQLLQEQSGWVRAAEFATKLIKNGYGGRQKYYDLIEKLLQRLISVPQYRLPAKDLVVALTLNRYIGTEAYLQLVETLLSDLLENGQRDEGMDLFNTLVSNGYPGKPRLIRLLLRSPASKDDLESVIKQVYLTSSEQAAFFISEGSQYLSTSKQRQAMVRLYRELLPLPGKLERLFVLLDSFREEDEISTVLQIPPGRDELAQILERYGKLYLRTYRQTPRLAQYVIASFRWLVQEGYSAKKLLFALFTSQANNRDLDALLTAANLSPEESREFFRLYGTEARYFPFFYQSAPILKLVEQYAAISPAPGQAEQLSAEKMEIVLSWLDPSKSQTTSLSPDGVRKIVQAATLTRPEQKQFLERYGQTCLLNYREFPFIGKYVGDYISDFTADAFEQPRAKEFMRFLSQKAPSLLLLDSLTRDRIHFWGTINHYFDSPTANPASLNALAAALFALSLPNDAAFVGKLAASFVQCTRDKNDLLIIITELTKQDNKRLNVIQLLYSMAEQCAQQHKQQPAQPYLAPYFSFVLSPFVPNLIPKRPEHLTQVFLDKLLCNVDYSDDWKRLNILVRQLGLSDDALNRWRHYLEGLGLWDRVTSGQDTANGSGAPKVPQTIGVPSPQVLGSQPPSVVSRPSRLARLKGELWDYPRAAFHMRTALRSREVDGIANTWLQYGAIISAYHPEQITGEERQQIDVASQFTVRYRAATENPQISIVLAQEIDQLASQIEGLALLCTPHQGEVIAFIRKLLREKAVSTRGQGPNPPTRSSSGSLPGEQVPPMSNIHSIQPVQNPTDTSRRQLQGRDVHQEKPKSQKTKPWWPRS